MIKTVLFDIGGVLLEVDFYTAIKKFAAVSDCDQHNIETVIHTVKPAYECGQINRGKFIAQVMQEINYSGTAGEFARIWQDIFTLNPLTASLVSALKPNYPLYLLSNTNDLHIDYVFKHFSLFRQFDGAVYSHIAGCMKPDRSIYEISLATFEINAGETVFIDDLAENIATARQLGFHTFQYTPHRHRALLEWLAKLDMII